MIRSRLTKLCMSLLMLAGLSLVAAAPTITSFTPASGVTGTSVVLTGTNFTGATAVKFNGTAAGSFTVNSATKITAAAPTGVTTGKLSVTTSGGTATSASNFTVAAPTLTSFTPASGAAGTTVTLTGTNFSGATAVKFNGTAASSFTVTSATKITATAPTGVTTGKLSVTSSGGTATSASSFTVTSSVPTITSFTPTSGGAGTTVTLTGTNFAGATAVKFNGTAASSFSVTNATTITAVAPTGVTTGKLSVTTPGGTATSSSSFTVVAAPTITNFTPTSGVAGTSVTLTGTNFTGATAVKFNGTAASSFSVTNATTITAVAPTGVTTGTISVTTPGGTATSASSFTVVAAPTITSFTPTSGAAGTSVILTGTNFTGATAVKFNGTAASSFSVTNATTVTAVAPTGVTTGKLSVTTPGGTTTSSSSFTVVAAPTITSFTPTSGAAGTSVTLIGTNFTGATGVKFNGTAASSFSVMNATTITAVAPTGVTTGKLSVTTPGGTATSSSSFTVAAPPLQPVITVPSVVTLDQTGYTASVPAQTGCTYAWSICSGTITAGSTTNQITFTPKTTVSMTSARECHTVTLMPNGKLLVAGGYNANGATASAELFDPAKGTFTATGSMTIPRGWHTATLLSTGKVLIAGGYDGNGNPTASAEIYDPSKGTFAALASSMAGPKGEHTATLLSSGQVLLAGGYDGAGAASSADSFDPSTSKFTPVTGTLSTARCDHTATLLANGQVLLAGGYANTGFPSASAELFNPASGTFTSAGSMVFARDAHCATLLPDGRVLLTGGCGSNWDTNSSAEYYDPGTGVFSALPASMTCGRSEHTSTLLSSGKVLLGGGISNLTNYQNAELFDPSTGLFSATTNTMITSRVDHKATRLANDVVLLTGGWELIDGGTTQSSVEFFDPASALFRIVELDCTVANSAGSLSDKKILTTLPAPAMPVITAPFTVITGRTGLTASVPAQSGCTFAWTITNGTFTGGGTTAIGTNVTFTAGTAGTPLKLTCVATNAAGSTKTATTNITVAPAFVTITPATTLLAPGAQQAFTANQPVYWNASSGTVSYSYSNSANATYTAPSGVGTYVLTATSLADNTLQAQAYITVYVDGSPVINSFTATPSTVHDGQSTTLNWNISNATSVNLDAIGDVTGQTNATLFPSSNMYYRLTASNDLGTVWANVNILVDLVPSITGFAASPSLIRVGESTQLTATFTNGIGSTAPNFGAIQSGVPLAIQPQSSQNCLLTVTNPYGVSATSNVTPIGVAGIGHSIPVPAPNANHGSYPTQLLVDREGRVILTGGRDSVSSNFLVERFDPSTSLWTTVGNFSADLVDYRAMLLPDGRILFLNGQEEYDDSMYIGAGMYLLDPTTGVRTTLNNGTGTTYSSAVPLDDGGILVAGGWGFPPNISWCNYVYSVLDCLEPKSAAAIYYPDSASWTALPAMNLLSGKCSGVHLLDGRVLLMGDSILEVFDPATKTFSVAGTLSRPVDSAAVRADGKVVLTLQPNVYGASQAGLWNPANGQITWEATTIAGCGPLFPDGRMSSGGVNAIGAILDPDSLQYFALYNQLPVIAGYYGPESRVSAILPSGRAFVADHTTLGLIDAESSLVIAPATCVQNLGLPVQFSVSGTASLNAFTWSASGGAITPDGVFTAEKSGQYQIKATTIDGTVAYARINITLPVEVHFPSAMSYPDGSDRYRAGEAWALTANVLHHPNKAVTWSLQEGAAAGTLTADGVYTASSAGTYHVVATSVADPSKSAVLTVNAAPPIGPFTLTPLAASVAPGGQVVFKVQGGTISSAATWACSAGSLNVLPTNKTSVATYTAPTQPGPYTVTATNPGDTTQSITATVTVVPDATPLITFKPSYTDCLPGANLQLTLTGTSASNYATTPTLYTLTGPQFPETTLTASYGQLNFTAPSQTGIYTVTAVQQASPFLSTTGMVYVLNIPKILSFSVSPKLICAGMPLTFNWATLNATTVTLNNNVTVPATGSLTIPYDGSAANNGTTSWFLSALDVNVDPGLSPLVGASFTTYKASVDLAAAAPTGLVYAGASLDLVSSLVLRSAVSLDWNSVKTCGFSGNLVWTLPGGSILSTSNGTVTGTTTDSAGGLVISQVTKYQAPSQPGTYTLKVSPAADTSKSVTLSIVVQDADVTLSVLPASATLNPGQCVTFGSSIQVTGSSELGINWSCDGGVLLPKGTYAFYAAPLVPGVYTVTVTSSANPSVSDSATVTVVALNSEAPSLGALPSAATLFPGQRVFLGANFMVSDPETGVDWSTDSGQLSPESSGASAFYASPATSGTFNVTLTGRTHTNLAASATITVSTESVPAFSVTPSAATLIVGQSTLLEAMAQGQILPNPGWSIQESNGGTITGAGMYVAPLNPGTYHVIASHPTNPSQTATATITVVAGGGGEGGNAPTNNGVSVSPSKAEVAAGNYQTLSAMVNGLENQGVTWLVEGAPASASVSTDGVFTANQVGTYRVFATSMEDPTLTGSAIISVIPSVMPIPGAPGSAVLQGFSVTALKDGRVLIAGGFDGYSYRNNAQIYDPRTWTLAATGGMNRARAWHTAVLLDDGRVLMSGGDSTGGSGCNAYGETWTAEVFDPNAGVFVNLPTPPTPGAGCYGPAAGMMRNAHVNGAAIKLGNGQVVIAGGRYHRSAGGGWWLTEPSCATWRRTDLFDPGNGTFDLSNWNTANVSWNLSSDCFDTLQGIAAVMLDDGRALVTGGYIPVVADPVDPCTGIAAPIIDQSGVHTYVHSYSACIKSDAGIFTPGVGLVNTSPMLTPRAGHTMTKLADGRILIVGGCDVMACSTPQTRDPQTNMFEPNEQFQSSIKAEIYDPATGVFSPTGNLDTARSDHAAILLPTGQVLIVGGYKRSLDGTVAFPNTTELYDPVKGAFAVADYLEFGLVNPNLALLPDGSVYITGTRQVPLYTPLSGGSNSWIPGTLFMARTYPQVAADEAHPEEAALRSITTPFVDSNQRPARTIISVPLPGDAPQAGAPELWIGRNQLQRYFLLKFNKPTSTRPDSRNFRVTGVRVKVRVGDDPTEHFVLGASTPQPLQAGIFERIATRSNIVYTYGNATPEELQAILANIGSASSADHEKYTEHLRKQWTQTWLPSQNRFPDNPEDSNVMYYRVRVTWDVDRLCDILYGQRTDGTAVPPPSGNLRYTFRLYYTDTRDPLHPQQDYVDIQVPESLTVLPHWSAAQLFHTNRYGSWNNDKWVDRDCWVWLSDPDNLALLEPMNDFTLEHGRNTGHAHEHLRGDAGDMFHPGYTGYTDTQGNSLFTLDQNLDGEGSRFRSLLIQDLQTARSGDPNAQSTQAARNRLTAWVQAARIRIQGIVDSVAPNGHGRSRIIYLVKSKNRRNSSAPNTEISQNCIQLRDLLFLGRCTPYTIPGQSQAPGLDLGINAARFNGLDSSDARFAWDNTNVHSHHLHLTFKLLAD